MKRLTRYERLDADGDNCIWWLTVHERCLVCRPMLYPLLTYSTRKAARWQVCFCLLQAADSLRVHACILDSHSCWLMGNCRSRQVQQVITTASQCHKNSCMWHQVLSKPCNLDRWRTCNAAKLPYVHAEAHDPCMHSTSNVVHARI